MAGAPDEVDRLSPLLPAPRKITRKVNLGVGDFLEFNSILVGFFFENFNSLIFYQPRSGRSS